MDKSKRIQYLEKVLRLMALLVLKKYKPKVIGITGSVGKTSAKEAIFTVLSKKFQVRKNEKNYNNEIGIPLTIIGVETGGRCLSKWFGIFLKWLAMLILPFKYPEVLILEMGVDRPGDMQYLLSFISPTIGVVTNISSSHIEFFKSLENIAKEKGKLIESLPADGFAIINADDQRVLKMGERTKAKGISFGFSSEALVNAANENYHYNGQAPAGISFKLSYDGTTMPVRLSHMLAKHQIHAALSAVAVGVAFKINLVEIATALENFAPPTGRLNIISGINGSFLMDDSYNASPASTIAALQVLGELKASRKIVAVGDMLELGSETEEGHRSVAKKILEINPELVFVVGKRMDFAVMELKEAGFVMEKVLRFASPDEATLKITELIKEGDIVLVKGSQGMRMEKISYALIANKDEAEKMICRQSKDWKEKPFGNP